MSTKNQLQVSEETLNVQSVFIPENWKANQENKAMGYLNWMAYTIQSKQYTNDQKVSDALLSFNQ